MLGALQRQVHGLKDSQWLWGRPGSNGLKRAGWPRRSWKPTETCLCVLADREPALVSIDF